MASVKRPYKARLSWESTKDQLGSYASLQSAIKAVDTKFQETGVEYHVYLDGELLYDPHVTAHNLHCDNETIRIEEVEIFNESSENESCDCCTFAELHEKEVEVSEDEIPEGLPEEGFYEESLKKDNFFVRLFRAIFGRR